MSKQENEVTTSSVVSFGSESSISETDPMMNGNAPDKTISPPVETNVTANKIKNNTTKNPYCCCFSKTCTCCGYRWAVQDSILLSLYLTACVLGIIIFIVNIAGYNPTANLTTRVLFNLVDKHKTPTIIFCGYESLSVQICTLFDEANAVTISKANCSNSTDFVEFTALWYGSPQKCIIWNDNINNIFTKARPQITFLEMDIKTNKSRLFLSFSDVTPEVWKNEVIPNGTTNISEFMKYTSVLFEIYINSTEAPQLYTFTIKEEEYIKKDEPKKTSYSAVINGVRPLSADSKFYSGTRPTMQIKWENNIVTSISEIDIYSQSQISTMSISLGIAVISGGVASIFAWYRKRKILEVNEQLHSISEE